MIKTFTILILIVFCLLFSASFALGGYEIEIALPTVPAGTEVDFAQYVSYFYTFGLSLVALLAVGGLVFGGFLYMFSDTIGSKEKAKQYLWSALSSLVLLFSAYLILHTINPNLVNLRAPTLPKIEAPKKTTPKTPKDKLEDIKQAKEEATWVGKCRCKVGEDPNNPNIYTMINRTAYGKSKSECENHPNCKGCVMTTPCAQK